jgi:hypothetical protein
VLVPLYPAEKNLYHEEHKRRRESADKYRVSLWYIALASIRQRIGSGFSMRRVDIEIKEKNRP